MSHTRNRFEAEHCIIAWARLFLDAWLNAPSQDSMSLSPASYHEDFMSTLLTLETSADSLWLRVTAKEMLAFEQMRRNDAQNAQSRFIALAGMRNSEPEIAMRALLALVALHTATSRNIDSALSACSILSQYYPGTKALMYAKVLLRLPLTPEDETASRPILPKTGDAEVSRVWAIPEDEGLAQPWPNPCATSTSLSTR